MTPPIILASGSAGRRELLGRLRLPFEVRVPGIDESRLPGEPPAALALRLSREKALAVARTLPAGLVIGSDQVAECGDILLGKPGTPEAACAQLALASGRRVRFWTGIALADVESGNVVVDVVRCDVYFRQLDPGEIARYVEVDAPLECAGSFRSEGLGISLFERLDTPDPTSLVGLPLIRLCAMLRAAGVGIPPAA